MNLTSFFGADMLDSAALAAQPVAAVGRAVLVGVDWLVEGKCYSVFSMLLGMGFAMQASRAEAHRDDVVPFFRRRMAMLPNWQMLRAPFRPVPGVSVAPRAPGAGLGFKAIDSALTKYTIDAALSVVTENNPLQSRRPSGAITLAEKLTH